MTAIESKTRVTARRLVLGLDDRAVEQIVEAVLERLVVVGETTPAKAPSRGGGAVSPKRRAVDTKTRYQGIYARHQVLLAEDDKARKSEAAWRVVPLAKPLRKRLWAEWVRQGKPESGRACPPRRESSSGKLSLNQLSKRIKKQWEELGLIPLGLQDSRHTAATWLDHAGVSPKVASVFMGHKAPNRDLHPDAAPVTQRLYTHVLDGELERARDRLDVFLAEREAEEREDAGAAAADNRPHRGSVPFRSLLRSPCTP